MGRNVVQMTATSPEMTGVVLGGERLSANRADRSIAIAPRGVARWRGWNRRLRVVVVRKTARHGGGS